MNLKNPNKYKQMKIIFVLIISLFKIGCLYAQHSFIISGKTNLLKNGKAVLLGNISHPLYSLNTKADTVQISNFQFKFEGSINYPEQHRIILLNNGPITEPFFVDSGFQEITIDSGNAPHDMLDFGIGVTVKGSKINDEYINNYLIRFNNIYKMLTFYFSEINRCDSITNLNEQKLCIINSDSLRLKLKERRDSILLNYSKQSPKSKIIPWLLIDALSYYGYNKSYQKSFEQLENNMPDKMKVYLGSLLTKEKLTAVESAFPLINFINTNISKNYLYNNKYTLVDFWFAKCRPCIGQFNLLKNIYKENSDKGFDIVAISIDKQSDLEEYLKTVSQNDYKWKQILDTGGIKAKLINISKYPTNFLLDSSGTIIAVDIKPFVLENFLNKNL